MYNQLKYKRTFKGFLNQIYNSQTASSKKRGHAPSEYSKEELGLWLKGHKDFQQLWGDWVLSDYEKYKRPSVDRLDDNKGYSFDNIRLVTWRVNQDAGYKNFEKKIEQVSKDGTVVETFDSITKAAKKLNTSHEMISRVCRGLYGRNTHLGYSWRYAS